MQISLATSWIFVFGIWALVYVHRFNFAQFDARERKKQIDEKKKQFKMCDVLWENVL